LAATTKEEQETQTVQSYAGAQLFPYPNRIKDAGYNFGDTNYTLPKNDAPRNHSLHGLIYDKPFTVDEIDVKSGRVALSYLYQKNHSGFPYDARIINEFQIRQNTLEVTTTIENTGQKEFPFGHGWHPYFLARPMVNDWKLQLPESEYYPFTDDLIPTGQTIKTQQFLTLEAIGTTDFNHCFRLKKDTKVILRSPDNKTTVQLELKGYSFLQIYIPPDRKSIALEPQTCAPDAFNNRIGLLHLKPKQQMVFQFSIAVNLKENEG